MRRHRQETLDVILTHQKVLLRRVNQELKTVHTSEIELPGEGDWFSFGDEKQHTNHLRRVFVAKYNPGEWGEPMAPELWDLQGPAQEWLWDAHFPDGERPANSSPGLRGIRQNDLIVVMRLRPTREKKPVPDRYGFDESMLLGVWVPVLVHRWVHVSQPLREMRPGKRLRLATQVFHVPLVRFTHEVSVSTIRRLDLKGINEDPEFSEANVTVAEVKDADGGRTAAARLLAACSLPGDLLTCRDPLALRGALAQQPTGMRKKDRKYWRDMRFRHLLRTVAETTAVDRSREHVFGRGFDFAEAWDHQYDPLWGGDYECWKDGSAGVEKLAVEVKGTGQDPWLGHVKLQRSQYDRACRRAGGNPLTPEADYEWELHVQAGIPRKAKFDLDLLPALDVRSAEFVRRHWKDPDWVS